MMKKSFYKRETLPELKAVYKLSYILLALVALVSLIKG